MRVEDQPFPSLVLASINQMSHPQQKTDPTPISPARPPGSRLAREGSSIRGLLLDIGAFAAFLFLVREFGLYNCLAFALRGVAPPLLILTTGRRRGLRGIVLIAFGMSYSLLGWLDGFLDSRVGYDRNPLIRLGLWSYDERWNLLVLGSVYSTLLLERCVRAPLWGLARRAALLVLSLGFALGIGSNPRKKSWMIRARRHPLTDGWILLVILLLLAWLIAVAFRLSPHEPSPGILNLKPFPMERAIRSKERKARGGDILLLTRKRKRGHAGCDR